MHILTKTGCLMYHVGKYKPVKCGNILRCFATDRPLISSPEWKLPKGFDTGIKVYNMAIREKVPLITRRPGMLTWYMCGPTVYDSAHIGHGLCYLRFDIIRRILSGHFRLNVVQVMGITDIDDKIINKANYFKVDIREISHHFEAEFMRDMALLGIQRATLHTRVTEHIDDITSFVQDILDQGLAYRVADGSVFFNNVEYRRSRGLNLPEEFDDRGADKLSADITDSDIEKEQLTNSNSSSNNSSSRSSSSSNINNGDRNCVDSITISSNSSSSDSAQSIGSNSDSIMNASEDSEWLTDEPSASKRHAIDFALWKSAKEGEPSWPAVFGRGRPGWHIECSAMACSIFGDELDVHSGGMDLRFPHHYCEEAQCCARHGASVWTNYWWHSGHLSIDSEKMSKSLGNVMSVQELLKTYTANAFRYFALSSHYNKVVKYHNGTLQEAAVQVQKIQSFLDQCWHFINTSKTQMRPNEDHPLIKELEETKVRVDAGLRDDFNTVLAIRSALRLISISNTYLFPDCSAVDVASDISSSDEPRNGTNRLNRTTKMVDGLLTNNEGNDHLAPLPSDSSTLIPVGRYEVAAVRNYIIDLMNMFGMSFNIRLSSTVAGEDIGGGVDSSVAVVERFPEVMDVLLEFRRKVRDYALLKTINKEQLATLSKADKASLRQERAELMDACDALRDRLAATAVLVKDHKDGASWSLSDDLRKKISSTIDSKA